MRVAVAFALFAAAWFVAGAFITVGGAPPWLLPVVAGLAGPAALSLALWKTDAGAKAAGAVAALLLLTCAAWPRPMTNGDTVAAGQLPWNVLRRRTLLLDGLPAAQVPAYWIAPLPHGHSASIYPPGIVFLALPFYLPAALSDAPPPATVLASFERATAAVLCATATLLLGLALRALGASVGKIAGGASLAALCTSMLSISSGALWQHTALAVALGATLFAVARKDRPASAVLAMAAAALIALARAPCVLLLLPFAWVARDRRRLVAGIAAGVAFGTAAFLATNASTYGSPFSTGYSIVLHGKLGFTLNELPESLVGLLVSPAHGLLLFSPWVLFALKPAASPIARACQIGALVEYALMAVWWCWWGSSFGPRMLAEAALLLAVPVAMAPPASRWGRATLVASALAAFAIHVSFPAVLAHDPAYSPYGAWIATAHPWVWFGSHRSGAGS